MAKTEYIKNFQQQILGTVDTLESGDQVARDFPSMKILGYYRKSRDVTTDFFGRVIAQGNCVVSLIFKK